MLAVAASAAGQTFGQSDTSATEVTMCDLYRNPDQYAGKMVKVRGTIAGNDMWIYAFTTERCSAWMSIVVVFPKQVRPAPAFDLLRDDSFQEFEEAMYQRRPTISKQRLRGVSTRLLLCKTANAPRQARDMGRDTSTMGGWFCTEFRM